MKSVIIKINFMRKTKENSIIFFKEKKIRRYWDENKELWFFSVIDVVEVLSESSIPRRYWSDLKNKIKKEGSQVYEKIVQLKIVANDGKLRDTDMADTENLFRLIQSIPSPKAEPFKLWLAKVGYERIEETEDPELGINRALETYLKKGYSKEWINQRLKSIEIRKELTDEWQERGAEKTDYAILTDEISKAWSDMTTKEYKQLKNLKKENLRDNMSNLELILNMLAETSTKEIHRNEDSEGVDKLKDDAKAGGDVAGTARRKLEKKLGRSVVSEDNFLSNKDKKKLS
jgi:hypothetical protein